LYVIITAHKFLVHFLGILVFLLFFQFVYIIETVVCFLKNKTMTKICYAWQV